MLFRSLLATHRELGDPVRALALAEQALKQKRTAHSLDTLAVALAANRQFFQAAKVANEALEFARKSKLEVEVDIRKRLELFNRDTAYTE